MAAPQEGQTFVLDNTITQSNGNPNGAIRIVNGAGDSVIPLAALPTADGDYTLRVAAGVYSWVLEGT